MEHALDLDTPLLKLSAYGDVFCLRDACAGVHCFGATGSGKSTGPAQALLAAYLRVGMGGIVCIAKPEEVLAVQRLARKHGRGNSLVIFDEQQGFNFIAHELARHGPAGIGNVVECLMRILASADDVAGVTGTAREPFWEQATRQVLTYALPVLYAADGTVTVPALVDFVTSAATRAQQYADEEWCATSFAARTLRRAASPEAMRRLPEHKLRPLLHYWMHEVTAVPDKTRGNVIATMSAKLDRFRHGRLRDLFCGRTTVVPEMTFQGAVIVLAMPGLTWNEDGVIAQQLFKYMWQRAVEARNALSPEQQVRPVFLFADESQYMVSPKDDEFLSTCRASRACVVYLSQSLPSYYARLGRDRTDAVNGLVGKFGTQIFLQNACPQTNNWASDLIGRGMQRRASGSFSTGTSYSRGVNEGTNSSHGTSGGHGGTSSGMGAASSSHNWGSNSSSGESHGRNAGRSSSTNETEGWSEQMDRIIEPGFFASGLLSGGPANHNQVTAVWFRAGARFAANDGSHFFLARFKQ